MTKRLPWICWLVVGLSLPVAVTGAEETRGEQLIAAAQLGDDEAVRALLADGVDVDSRSKYGATALFFACDKGNVELVRLLLESGASVDVQDTFYQASPLGWTLYYLDRSPQYRQIALLLLTKNPSDASNALTAAIRVGDEELARAAVATGKIEAPQLVDALGEARRTEQPKMVSLLRELVPEDAAEPPSGPAPVRAGRYLGDYENSETAVVLQVTAEQDELRVSIAGQEPVALVARGDDLFVLPEYGNLELRFVFDGEIASEVVARLPDGDSIHRRRTSGEEGSLTQASNAPLEQEPERGVPQPWPAFRGPSRSGIADGQGAPTRWSGKSGNNVVWKTPIPGVAHSSPVIWGDRIFLSTASSEQGDESLRIGLYGDVDSVEDESEHVWQVLALDRRGRVIWQREASRGVPKAKRHLKSTHANPTPATDGRHVVVNFASEGLFCYDLEGNLLWKKELGRLRSGYFYDPTYEWGFASSPILHEGVVFAQIDTHDRSYVVAFDAATGSEQWSADREEISTWGTPLAVRGEPGEPDQIVTNGTTIRSYNAATGELLWWLSPNSEITVASPIAENGLIYVTGGYPPARPIYAIRQESRGDLSLPTGESRSAAVAWSVEPGGAYMPTPLAYRDILYVFHNDGRLAAHDATTGERIFRRRVANGQSFAASPIAADGRLYFTAEDGTTYVATAGRSYRQIAENVLGEIVMSTPAVSDGLMVIRAKSHVFGIAASD